MTIPPNSDPKVFPFMIILRERLRSQATMRILLTRTEISSSAIRWANPNLSTGSTVPKRWRRKMWVHIASIDDEFVVWKKSVDGIRKSGMACSEKSKSNGSDCDVELMLNE